MASPNRLPQPSAAANTPSAGNKRPAMPDTSTIDSFFAAKRARPSSMLGVGLKLRVVQRGEAITEVSGDTEKCKEMLLKPLGFRWVKARALWQWDGNGDPTNDPSNQLLERAALDGVSVELVSRDPPAVAPISAAAQFARLMADIPTEVEAESVPVVPPASEAPPPAQGASSSSLFDDIPDEAFFSVPEANPALPSNTSPHLPAPPSHLPPTAHPAVAISAASRDDWEIPDDVLASLPDRPSSGSAMHEGSQASFASAPGEACSQSSHS